MSKIIAQIELPEMDELLKTIEKHRELLEELRRNALKMNDLYLQINFKLKENQ